MEQAPSLIISTTTPQPSTPPTPVLESSKPVSSSVDPSGTLPPAPVNEQPNSPTETIRAIPPSASVPAAATAPLADLAEKATAVVERAKQHGLYAGNIEEEVGQVIGTLSSWGGSFWGGVKKQSASAFTTLKTDLDKTVSQAQADLKRLQTTSVEVVRKDPEQYKLEQAAEKAQKAAKSASTPSTTEPTVDEKGKGKAREIDLSEPPANALPGLPPAASAFLDRLTQSTNSLQASLQTTLNSAKQNPALSNPAALRDQLAENLRLTSAKENLTLSLKQAEKLAEEYVKKGEGWLHDAEKWVGEVVKVVPPDEEGTRHVWDGNDFYSFSTSSSSSAAAKPPAKDNNVLFDFGAQTSRTQSTVNMAGSRKEALLRRLREDKELLLVDPEGEGETAQRKEEFRKWVGERWEKEGKEGRAAEEGNIGGIRMGLVPEQLTDEQFWQRYLFHKHMIEAEDEKRKKLLEATQQTQADDFSWDDEEDPTSPDQPTPPTPTSTSKHTEESSTPIPSVPVSTSTSTPTNPAVQPNAKATKSDPSKVPAPLAVPSTTVEPTTKEKEKNSTNTSPRDSEESYDLVSDQKKDKQSEDEDSDWE